MFVNVNEVLNKNVLACKKLKTYSYGEMVERLKKEQIAVQYSKAKVKDLIPNHQIMVDYFYKDDTVLKGVNVEKRLIDSRITLHDFGEDYTSRYLILDLEPLQEG